jgi:hypothetical protein
MATQESILYQRLNAEKPAPIIKTVIIPALLMALE